MTLISKIPVVRMLHRYYREVTRPAPLDEFGDYDEYWEARVLDGRRAKVLDRHRIIAELLPDDATVLDIGCGDGAFLAYLQQHKPRCRLMGADISSVAIGELQKLGIEGIVIDPSQPLDRQIRKGWDAVVLMEVIEHVIDAEDLVRQSLSLEPRRLFITIPNVGFLLHRLRLMCGRFPVTAIMYHMKEHVRFWTVKDFLQWAPVNGLRVVSYHGQAFRRDRLLLWLIRRFPALFSDRLVYEMVPDGKNSA